MVTLVFIFTFVLLLSHVLLNWWRKSNKWNHFPGPSKYASFPVVGHTYKMANRKMHEVMRENHAKYGDIYRFDLGKIQTVVLTNYEDICEAYKSDIFGGRSLQDLPGLVVMKPLDQDGDMAGLSAMVSDMCCVCMFSNKISSVSSIVRNLEWRSGESRRSSPSMPLRILAWERALCWKSSWRK